MGRGMSSGLRFTFPGLQGTDPGGALRHQDLKCLRFVEGTAAEKARNVINRMLDYRFR